MRKAMLVAPSFFGYHVDIERELQRRGYSVDYISDRPSESVVFKSLGRISYEIVQKSIDSHYYMIRKLLIEGVYDFVLFVGGMSICFSREQMEGLRHASDATFCLYLWDALANCQRVGSYIDLFDYVYSFEPSDCNDSNIKFLPLFYVSDYARIPEIPDGGFTYDACFIGSVHQISKFENVKRIVSALEKGGARVYCHYYMPSRSSAILRSATHRAYRDVQLRYEPLARHEVAQIYAKSRTVIDSPQGGQSGLTMRSIETLGARRRLITANTAVMQYDFYQYGNVLVCNDNESLDARFAKRDPVRIPKAVWQEYSITSWIDKLLKAMN